MYNRPLFNSIRDFKLTSYFYENISKSHYRYYGTFTLWLDLVRYTSQTNIGLELNTDISDKPKICIRKWSNFRPEPEKFRENLKENQIAPGSHYDHFKDAYPLKKTE